MEVFIGMHGREGGREGAPAPVNGKRFPFLWKFVGKKVKSVSLQMGAIRAVMIVIL
jgi:hypothetical protein